MQVICWRKTFQIVSAPGRLLEGSLAKGLLPTAAGRGPPCGPGAVAGPQRLVPHLPHSPGTDPAKGVTSWPRSIIHGQQRKNAKTFSGS